MYVYISFSLSLYLSFYLSLSICIYIYTYTIYTLVHLTDEQAPSSLLQQKRSFDDNALSGIKFLNYNYNT